MKLIIGIIGDIVGRIGRNALCAHLPRLRESYGIDLVIANAENASGGFGLNIGNANELFSNGVDIITGGNHSFDKLEIIPLMAQKPILRPLNYPPSAPGSGIFKTDIKGEKCAVINAMGHYGININVDNVYYALEAAVNRLRDEGFRNIIIDFHAEASSEKRMVFCMLRGEITALFGTHTHTGSDDLHIQNGSFYVSDVGLCGAFDGVIGMDYNAPLNRAKNGYGKGAFEVPKNGNEIFQMIILEITQGACLSARKVKILNGKRLEDMRAPVL